MPQFDKTGPEGKGPQTGLGLGNCSESNENNENLNMFRGRCFRRNSMGSNNRPGFGRSGRGRCFRRRNFLQDDNS